MDTDVISENLGGYGVQGHEDIIHEIYSVLEAFQTVGAIDLKKSMSSLPA